MNTIVTAIIITGAIGLVAAALLTIASKLMHVEADPKAEQLRDALPGANCGACGYSGCDGYAEALAKGETTPDLCPPGGEATFKQLCEILGLDAADGPTKKIAIVRCVGDTQSTSDKMKYIGIETCQAANHLYGGQGACAFGCIGYGDCAKVCKTGAICINNGLAYIDPRKCNNCGLCVKACPTGVIAIETEPVRAMVLCQNTEKGAIVRKKCKKGCIACTKCVRECPCEAITITDNLAVIDNTKCNCCGHCAAICVTKCIAIRN